MKKTIENILPFIFMPIIMFILISWVWGFFIGGLLSSSCETHRKIGKIPVLNWGWELTCWDKEDT